MDDTLTLALNGEVTVEEFSRSIRHFSDLITALKDEVGGGATITWVIYDLQVSSAIATVRGLSNQPDKVEDVKRAYIEVGRHLEERTPIPFGRSVQTPARGLVSVLGTRIISIRFETADEDVTVASTQLPPAQLESERMTAYGAVVGRIQTLSNRQGLRFTLYDSLHDRAVSCYLQEGKEEVLRGLWGSRVIVHGWVNRDLASGRPIVIRRISRIDSLPDKPNRHSYLSARGVAPRSPDDPLPEETIRRIRDAW